MRFIKNLSIVFVLMVCSHSLLIAQTKSVVKKIHGYEQVISGGAAVTSDGSNPSNAATTRYFIYLETAAINSVTIQSVYIKGIAQKGKAVKSPTTIQLPGENGKTKMVSSSSNKLWQVELEAAEEAAPNALKNLVLKNEVVVTGFAKGQKFTAALKKLKVLKPVDAE